MASIFVVLITVSGILIMVFYDSTMLLRIRWYFTTEHKIPHFILKNAMALRLHPGTDKSQITIIKPQNIDNESIWVWMANIDEYKKAGKSLRWSEMLTNNQCIFVIFVNDKLIQPPRVNSEEHPLSFLFCYYMRHKESREEIHRLIRNNPEFNTQPWRTLYAELFEDKSNSTTSSPK